MKFFYYLLFLVTINLVSVNASHAVLVDSVRYCRSGVPIICNGKTHGDYQAWEDHGVPDRHQKHTYIARYSNPSIETTRHLIFVADGQANGPDFIDLNGVNDNGVLSGRPENVSSYFGRFDASREITELNGHLAEQLFSDRFPAIQPGNSFAAAAWDARFHYKSATSTLNRIANAYYDWLKSKFIEENLDVIILAGHSRGGALVTVLAQKFKAEYPDIPVMVYTGEAVSDPKRSELIVSTERIQNPLETFQTSPITGTEIQISKRAYRARFDNYYPSNRDSIRVVNILTGLKFIPVDSDVRPFAHRTNLNGEEPSVVDWGWFKQHWLSDFEHSQYNNSGITDYFVDDIENFIGRISRRNFNSAPIIFDLMLSD